MNRYAILLTLAIALCPHGATAHVPRAATPGDKLKVPPGFKAELLHSATEQEGSWVSMAVDDKGRLYVSAQAKQFPPLPPYEVDPLIRITLTSEGKVEKRETVPLKVGGAMGLLWAFDSLYVSGVGPEGQGIYRLFDTDKDDTLDRITLFKRIPDGWNEHGAHAMVVGPDEQLYIANGNSTPLVEGTDVANSPHRNWKEDYLLAPAAGSGAAVPEKLKLPYGCVYQVDPDGKRWTLFAGGFRNHYDIDFNRAGELFTFDSDTDLAVGLPWYRPSRILHVTSGADFGYRQERTKWPPHYPDSLGAVVDVGRASPTGVKFGTKSNFPDKYRRAFFALDWTYGRVLAVHMKPAGATYVAENPLPNPYHLEGVSSSEDVEVFLSGPGMPVTDIEFGADGAMYLIVGGRGVQAGLYRISYAGTPDATPTDDGRKPSDHIVELRRSLEAYHGKHEPNAVESAWPHLASRDRHVRYAARIAIEGQPVGQWSARALDESDPLAAMTALLAVARVGGQDLQEPLLKALAKFPLDSLDEPLQLDQLRVIQLSFIRQGRPADATVQTAIETLSKRYPAQSFALNRELSLLLVWLNAPDALAKTLALMNESKDPAEQVWYACVLREARNWTSVQQTDYFTWFGKTAAYKRGTGFEKVVGAIRDQELDRLPAVEKSRIVAMLKAASSQPVVEVRPASGVQRAFQREWSMADLEAELPKASVGRNFERGKQIFASASCLACHRFNNEGGGTGPDISAVASRFNRRDLLESILDPSKVISEQYASYVVKTRNNQSFSGLIAEENNDHLMILTDPLSGTMQKVGAAAITHKQLSPVSAMPGNLLDVLTKDEILDLLAYIEAGGDRRAASFGAAAE